MVRPRENSIMSSTEVIKIKHQKLGITGKWLKLMGDITRSFTAMIYGLPKMGKSYFSVDFAGYLAKNHGTVLYVAKEEGFDETFRIKLEETKAVHPDLYVSDYLPDDLSPYNFIILDSVTRLGLNVEDLNRMKEEYPDKGLIYIFQATKQGKFRGSNEFQHDVDIVLEVPEKGLVTQFGRFNQGGEMDIFQDVT